MQLQAAHQRCEQQIVCQPDASRCELQAAA
jgi:hypothetical protein